MVVLSLDTSHPVGSAALARGGEAIRTESFGRDRSHMVEMASTVEKLLSLASLEPARIDRIALVEGPGSFTGLRIGMAFVKGLHGALGTEVVTMNTLELLALPVLEEFPLAAPMIDARKGQVYAALYGRSAGGSETRPGVRLEPLVAPPEEAVERIAAAAGSNAVAVVGSGVAGCTDSMEGILAGGFSIARPEFFLPSTKLLAEIACWLEPLSHEEIVRLEPFYIRPSDAELKRLGQVRIDG